MTKSIPLIAALLAGSVILPANAALVLSVAPASQTVNLGDQVSIDILFSGLEDGLDEIVSAYDLTLSFDESILAYSSGTYLFEVDVDLVIGSGEISWNSFSLESDTTLQGQQGNSVTLASLVFDTVSAGTSPFTFTFDDVVGLGGQTLVYSVEGGSATVETAVPLPPTIALLGLGVFGMIAARRGLATA